MITTSQIKALAEQALEGTDRFLVEVLVKPGNRIYVFIDSDSSVLIEHCVELSRHIESNLNRDAEDFELNISSSGIDQPYRMLRQYRKNIGRQVSVVMNDGSRIAGKLVAADENGIEVLEQKKEKKTVTSINHRLEFVNIKETKEIIKF